ncbi:MAG TPA: glycosyl hydrolase family 28 protein [Verrucomicrobiae bacterium]|nr:glycosyl hydrolase family 28 protein [Verrucomicrobiae bacterium]
MKSSVGKLLVLTGILAVAQSGQAAVYVDDFWADGSRSIQNLPTESAWFTSSSSSLTAATSNMTLTVGGSAVFVVTYFTTNSTSPVQLNVGDTLQATFHVTFSGLPGANSSEGFRIGLFDFADSTLSPKRVTSDASISGNNALGNGVQGYALFQNMATVFTNTNQSPIDVRKRTNVSDSHLLGTSGDWTSLATGPGNVGGFPGFSSSTPYILQLTLQRTGTNSAFVTMSWANTLNGSILVTSVTDTSATNFNFDGIALRPQDNTTAAATTVFNEARVEVIPAGPPLVNFGPLSQGIFSNQTATFNVLATGTPPLFYQWYYNTNSLLNGATNSTLTITNAQPSDAGAYAVVVSNSYGSVTSAVAQLSVTTATAPSITIQPQDTTVIPGETATFTVQANGTLPLSYQWYFNNVTPVSNGTSATVTITNVQVADGGDYSVVVSNLAGTATSSNAVLNVNTNPVAPVFTSQPSSLNVSAGDTVNFSATAAGTAPVYYQWSKNNVAIAGATLSTLTLVNVQTNDDGNYALTASNSVGNATSSNATLVVSPPGAPPPLPVIPPNLFLITNYGAHGDGVGDNAAAIQSAMNAAAAAGGGTVEVPAAGTLSTYLSGPIILTNNVDLQIDSGAMLQALPMSSWPNVNTAFITATNTHDVEISGSGTIDGQGAAWWPGGGTRPPLVQMAYTTRILVQNVTAQNPPFYHFRLIGGNTNVTVQNVTINTPTNSPNTDGVDLSAVNALVQNCWIQDGDDDICIKNDTGQHSANIVVTNCTFNGGHGVSIGSDTAGGFENFLVDNCSFRTTIYGIRCKSDNSASGSGAGGLVQNLTYSDLTMTNVEYPIVIYSYYNEVGTPDNIAPSDAAGEDVGSTNTCVIWRNITFRNVTATVSSLGKDVSAMIWGRLESPISNLVFDAVNIVPSNRTFTVFNARGVQIIDSNLGVAIKTNTLTIFNAQVTITNSVASTNALTLVGLAVPPTNNILAFYNAPATIVTTNLLALNQVFTVGGSTLTVSNTLNLGATSALNFALGTNAARIAATGNLILGGTLNVSDGGGFAGGTYTLFTYGGALTYNGLTIGATPGPSFAYAISTNTHGQVNLIVSNSVTAPIAGFTGIPLSGPAPLAVGFTDIPSNSPTAWYWTFGDGGTSTVESPTYTYVTPGRYTAALIASNSGGASAPFVQTVNVYDPFAWWRLQYFGSTNSATGMPDADPYGKGISNTNQFLLGLNPTNPASVFRILSVAPQANGDMKITWATGAGATNVVQASSGDGNGGYSTNFTDISGPMSIAGSGDVTNTFPDPGGAINNPSRYYRIRLGP